MKKAVVSGANGFLGTALCRELSEQGVEIIAIVRDQNSHYEDIKNLKNLRLVFSELSDFGKLDEMIKDRDVDVFYHLAWNGSAGKLRGDPDTQLKNVKYSCDLLRACRNSGCRRFVFASSIMAYEIMAVMNTDAEPDISTLYSSAKLCADHMLRTMAGNLGIRYIRAVISNIYGPGERSPRLVNASLRKMLKNVHCPFTAGEQTYDFIYISDAAKEMSAIGEKGKANRAYYIGSLHPRPLKEFLYEMRDQVNPQIQIGIGEIPFEGVSLAYDEFDIHAVKNDTGVFPVISFSEGIRKTIEWLKETEQ